MCSKNSALGHDGLCLEGPCLVAGPERLRCGATFILMCEVSGVHFPFMKEPCGWNVCKQSEGGFVFMASPEWIIEQNSLEKVWPGATSEKKSFRTFQKVGVRRQKR